MSLLRRLFTRHPRGEPNPTAFIEALLKARDIGRHYNPEDRYQDFRLVFMNSPEGQRVLYEILHWSGVFESGGYDPADPYALHIHEGGRQIGHKLLTTLNAEPPHRDDQNPETE